MSSNLSPRARRQTSAFARKLLRKHLSPGYFGWIEQLASAQAEPERLYPVFGFLASIALSLERTYQNAGGEVRDLIWQLHAGFKGPVAELGMLHPETTLWTEWLQDFLTAPEVEAERRRKMLFQWTEIASERLTMRRYHRPDHLARHAHILFSEPIYIALQLETPARDPGATTDTLESLMLRFFDLIDVERQAALGRNRISHHENAEFGGFYGIAEDVQPPEAATVESRMKMLVSDLGKIAPDNLSGQHLVPISQSILRDMTSAIHDRLESGAWPKSFTFASRSAEQSDGFLKKIFGVG